MQTQFSPMKMSLAGMRLTGYIIEANMRMAKVFCEAALKSNPLLDAYDGAASAKVKQKAIAGSKPLARAKAKAKASKQAVAKPKAVKAKVQEAGPRTASAGPAVEKSLPKAVKGAAPASAKPTSEKTAAPKSRSPKPAASDAKVAKPAATKRKREPSPPPAMPSLANGEARLS